MAISKTDCVTILQRAGMGSVEAEDMVNRLLREKADLKAAGGTPRELSRAWANWQADNQRKAAMKQRQAVLNVARRHEARAFLSSVREQGFSTLDGMRAMLVGSGKRFDGARRSIAFQRRGIFASWAVPMIRELEAVGDGTAMRLLREDKTFHDDVFREMRSPHSTGNDDACSVADIFARYGEQAIDRQNAVGADIRKRRGWTPQIHDPEKMLKAGEKGWVDFTLERLDREATFGKRLADEEARAVLRKVYQERITGVEAEARLYPTDGGPLAVDTGENIMLLSRARRLHFRDADAAIQYHDAFGRGSLLDVMVRQLSGAARRVSLAERLGANPRAMLLSLLEDERTALARDKRLPQKERLRRIEELDVLLSRRRLPGRVENWLAELTGETSCPVSPTAARAGRIARAVQSLSKLGGAALSAVTDVGTKAASMRTDGGLTWGEALRESLLQYVRRYDAREREIAGQTGVFLDYLSGELAARWDVDMAMPGKLTDLNNALFKYSGLNWITEKGRSAMTLWLSQLVGGASVHGWDALAPDLRAMLEWHGVTAPRWEALRRMVQPGEDGRTYFAPVEARHLPDEVLEDLLPEHLRKPGRKPDGTEKAAQWEEARRLELERTRQRLETDSLAMLADEVSFAVIEADDATRAVTRQGTRPGTLAGEMWRLVMQFKSFPIAYMQRIMGGRRWVRGSRQEGMAYGFSPASLGQAVSRDIPGVVGFTLTMLSLGFASQTLHDIARGKTPRDPRKWETWAAAAARSGGLGIYGDFLFGKLNRFGNTFAETMAGPTITSVVNPLSAVPGALLRGDGKALRGNLAAMAMDNAPFVNFWMTRAALDWLLLHHLRESLSPGSLRRMERKARQDYGQDFILSPTRDRVRLW